jgi:CRP-like cAMP-binding protein
MMNIDIRNEPKSAKIFGTADCAVALSEIFAGEDKVKAAFSRLPQAPVRFYRDNVIACEGDRADNVFFVVRGVARSCKNCRQGVRNIVAFYLPGDFFGWTELKHSLSIEAVTDMVLFIKRSALLAPRSRDTFVGRFLLRATTIELMRRKITYC